MPKNKATPKRQQPRKVRVRRKTKLMAHPVHDAYAKALVDPCQGPLLSVYPGEKGSVGRYVLDQTFTLNAPDTAFVGGFWPSLNGAFFQTCANGSAIVVPTWSSGASSSVASSTITALYNKTRPIAACAEISIPAVSALNVVGELCTACLSAGTFQPNNTNGNTLSPNDMFSISPSRYILQRKVYEQKFSPGSFDSRYSIPFDFSSQDSSDTNALFFAGRGLPAGVSITIKWTVVYEGTAKRLSGLATSATNMRGGSHDTAVTVAAALHAKHPSWAAGVKDFFGGILNTTASGFANSVGQNIGRNLATRAAASSSSWGGPIVEELIEAAPLMLTL